MKNSKQWIGSLLGLTLLASPVAAWKMPYPEPRLKYPAAGNMDSELDRYWAHWKSLFLNGGVIKATDPSNNPKFVSEAQSYGMLMAVWMNDQATFKTVYNKTQSVFWNSSKGYYGWLANAGGTGLQDGNFAGDADLDIAGALIFASVLVDKGYWTDGSPSFKAQAKTILENMKSYLVDGNGYIYSWPGQNSALNPSYHLVHWYPVFKQFADSNKISTADWNKAYTAAYSLFKAQTNSSKGMARSWSNSSGGASGCGSCQSSPNIDAMGFDGIRVPWRIGLDAIWHRSPDAMKWLKSTWDNAVAGTGINITKPGMYNVDGPTLRGWCGTDETNCKSEYERTLSRAMWGAAAVAARDTFTSARVAGEEIYGNFSVNNTYDHIGDYPGGVNASDIDKNYYTQSLALFGVLAMTGNAPNIWGDIKYKWVPNDTSTKVTVDLKATPDSIAAGGSTRLTATASKAVKWRIKYKAQSTGAAGAWTLMVGAATKAAMDTTFTFKNATLAGQVYDVKAYWDGGLDTARTTIRVTGSSSIRERPVFTLAKVSRLEGSLLRLDANLGHDAIESVRFLDAKGAVIAATSAVKSADGLLLGQAPAIRGLGFFEILTKTEKFQGRVFKL